MAAPTDQWTRWRVYLANGDSTVVNVSPQRAGNYYARGEKENGPEMKTQAMAASAYVLWTLRATSKVESVDYVGIGES